MDLLKLGKYLSLIIAFACLGACQADLQPRFGYADKDHPLSDTSIVICGHTQQVSCLITKVDGMSMGGSQWKMDGLSRWARVLPGKHTIEISARGALRIGYADVALDALPQHVYTISITSQLTWVGGTFRPEVTDLGRMSTYEVHKDGSSSPVIAVATFH